MPLDESKINELKAHGVLMLYGGPSGTQECTEDLKLLLTERESQKRTIEALQRFVGLVEV